MPNLDAIDTAIAVVIVLLLLSLIVQSVQELLKKLLKIKSRQLEQSLVDLFQHIVARPTGDHSSARMRKSPILQLLTPKAKHAAEEAGGDVKELFDAVVQRFKEIGRVSVAGKAMLDSLSKDDLTKVLRSVAPNTLLPDLVNQLKEATTGVKSLQDALEHIEINHLEGEASAKFAAMRDALEPVLSDIRSIMSGKELKPALVLGDVMSLRQIKLDEVLKLLGEVQSKVEEDIKTEEAKPTSIKLEGLELTSTGLKAIAKTIIEVRQKFDTALAPLRTKLTEVEVWYDTVMQSFNERYTRSMKTWAVIVSAVVVVFLNANFFNIYQNITTNDVVRNLIIQSGPEVLARAKDAKASESKANQDEKKNQSEEPKPSPSPSSSPTASPGSVTLTTITTTSPPTGVTTTTTTQDSDKQTTEELLSSFKKIQEQIKGDANTFASFGFAPLTYRGVRTWLGTLGPPENTDHPYRVWFGHRGRDFKTLLGWAITAMLLSVGAPFWQDALESLFGIKNLLRKRSDTKNVEDKGGNPKP
ncbi:MAG: hypothetical protein ACR2LM_13965 [Pyrinomonadaceae bacterium]